MNLFIDKHVELLSLLKEHDVAFIVVGGYSVIYHGYPRTTGDVDIWLENDNSNKEKFIGALRQFDIDESSLGEIESFDFCKPLAFSLWEEPEKVEFLTQISGVSYAEANRDKIMATVDNLAIPFLHLNHLIVSKMSTGRLKDLADVEELQKVQRLSKE